MNIQYVGEYGMFNLFKSYNLSDVESYSTQIKDVLSITEKRKAVKIAVIDDQYFQPFDNLRDNGFDVIFIGNVNEIRELETYSLILCDIGGVANKVSKELEGAALVEEIKRVYSEKYVIVYTGFTNRNPKVKHALKYADDFIKKAAELDQWNKLLDHYVNRVLDPLESWKLVRKKLLERNVSASVVAKLESKYAKSIVLGNPDYIANYTRKIQISDDVRPIIQGLVSSAIWSLAVGL